MLSRAGLEITRFLGQMPGRGIEPKTPRMAFVVIFNYLGDEPSHLVI